MVSNIRYLSALAKHIVITEGDIENLVKKLKESDEALEQQRRLPDDFMERRYTL